MEPLYHQSQYHHESSKTDSLLAVEHPSLESYPRTAIGNDEARERHRQPLVRERRRACAATRKRPGGEPQSLSQDWFHSLPFQRFQALLTLFSKSFSFFPQGICALSASSFYLFFNETYHPLCISFPKSVNPHMHAVHKNT